MGELNFFLGLQVHQMENETFISQTKYTKELIKKFGMENCTVATTLMGVSIKLDKDEGGISVDATVYRGLIGSLLYLTANRPDIVFAVCLCARFQSNPKQSHFVAGKRILRYLKGTRNVGLWYAKHNSFNLVGYLDADYAGCKMDRKSTKSCCAQLLWIQQQLRDYGIEEHDSPIFCDKTSTIAIAYNPILHSRTKHIEPFSKGKDVPPAGHLPPPPSHGKGSPPLTPSSGAAVVCPLGQGHTQGC
ncbi:secreted RxLR effector protein 161-like [Henckelia pumila]|uniref:secreted RxLR effector protein 161-like n=1 Tax=Henckelia pumila TaxID=405737 RepID=UPI003C6E6D3A